MEQSHRHNHAVGQLCQSIFFCILLASSCKLAAAGLILNPSFEEGDDRPAVWISSGKEPVEWAHEAASGKRSLALVNGRDNPRYSTFYQGFELTARTTYRLSFRYRTRLKKGKALLRITNAVRGADGNEKKLQYFYLPEYQEFDPVAGAARWKDHAVIFDTGGAFKTYITLELNQKPGQKVWFDDFRLQPFWLKNPRTIESCEITETARINCFFDSLVVAENPSRIASRKLTCGEGGLDAGMEGDEACFVLASHLDKRWHGGMSNPEGIEICFELAPDATHVEVEVGYFNVKDVTRRFDITLDDMLLGQVRTPPGEYGSKDNRLKVFRAKVDLVPNARRPKHSVMRVFQSDSWGKTIIDALVVHGKGVRLLDPHTRNPLGDVDEIFRKRRELIASSHVKLSLADPQSMTVGSPGDTENGMRIEPVGWSEPKVLDGRPCRVVRSRIDGEKYRREFTRDRERSVDVMGAEFSASATTADADGIPRESIGLDITYRDDLDKPALLYSWMGYHKNRPWELLKGSPSQLEVEVIGGKNDKQWKTARIVIPKTPWTRLRARDKRYCFKLAAHQDLPVASVRLFTLDAAETEAWNQELTERRMLKYNLQRRSYVESRKRRKPTKEERQRGYILENRSALDLVFPNSNPSSDATGTPEINAWTVPGRTAATTFALFPLRSVGSVKLNVGALKCGRDVLESGAVGIKVAGCTMMSYPAFRAQGPFLRAPYFLLDGTDIHIGTETKWIWLIVDVPGNTAPGVYRGELKLSANTAAATIPITLEVLPLRLRKTGRFFAMYPGQATDPSRFSFDQIEVFLRDQKKHGMNAGMLAWRFFLYNGFLDWRNYNPDDGSYNVELMDTMIQLLRKHGLLENNRLMLVSPKPKMVQNYTGTDRLKAYTDIIKAIEREGQKRGWPQLVWMPVDEPGESNMASATACVQAIKTVGGVTGGTVQQWSVEQYGAALDLRAYGSRWFAQSRSIDGLLDIKTDVAAGYAGANLASYGHSWGLRSLEERCSSWWLWKSARIPEGFTMLRWNYLHYWYDGYDNLDVMYEPEGWLRYDVGVGPAWRGGICPTIIWEQIRQSVIDLEFVYTLEKLIAAAEGSGLKRAAAKAKAVLDAVKGQIPDEREAFALQYIQKPFPALQRGSSDFYTDYSFDFETFDQWRRQIADASIELEKASAATP
ncbi:MAG: hypothetical protein KAI66_20305 [Lentisphaeria bacterium]|nr:hypothetical protein [Lentisphaeria bacterium]